MYWAKDAEYGCAKQQEKGKTTEELRGCSEGGLAEGDKEADDLFWKPPSGSAARRRR